LYAPSVYFAQASRYLEKRVEKWKKMQEAAISPAKVVAAQPASSRKRATRLDDDDDDDQHSHRSKKSPEPAPLLPKASKEAKLPLTSPIFVDKGADTGQAQGIDDDEEDEEDEEEQAQKKVSENVSCGDGLYHRRIR